MCVYFVPIAGFIVLKCHFFFRKEVSKRLGWLQRRFGCRGEEQNLGKWYVRECAVVMGFALQVLQQAVFA